MKKFLILFIITFVLIISIIGFKSLISNTKPEKESYKIKLIVPHLGFNDEQIITAKAKPGGLTPHDDYYMAVRKSVEETYSDYDVDWVDWGDNME